MGITARVLRRAQPHRQHQPEGLPSQGPSLARQITIGRRLTNHQYQEGSI